VERAQEVIERDRRLRVDAVRFDVPFYERFRFIR